MKEIIEILRGEFYGLFCGIFGCVIDSILMITLFGKKKYSYILPEMLGLRFVIYNVGLLLIANHFYGGQQWFRLMMPTIASASTFLIMFLTTFLWKEQLAKVLLGFCLCDFGGTAIVYGVPSLGFHPVVNAILSIIIFLIIYKIITPLLKKYQNYRIKHSYICSEILIVLILSGWLSNFLYVSIEDSVAAQDTMLHKMGIYFSTMVALSVTVVFFIYSIQLSRRKKQLIYATEQMESYYSKVTIQVNELQEFRQDVEEGFEEILKTKKAGSVKEKKQSVLAYVEHLQERYQSINDIFFCFDYIVDGLLYDFKISRQKQQKKTDILFQNYDRGLIRQEDALGIQYTSADGSTQGANVQEGTDATQEAGEEETTEAQPEADKSALDSAISDAGDVDQSKYTEDSFKVFEEELESAKTVSGDAAATQNQVDAATNTLKSAQEGLKEKSNKMIFIAIGGVAFVIIIVVLIIVMSSKKKKKANSSSNQSMNNGPVNGGGFTPPSGGGFNTTGGGFKDSGNGNMQYNSPSQDYYGEGAGETSVLNEGAGETTLLSGQSMAQATLYRESNCENIRINKGVFTLGKERKKVDYCISDNSSVSRTHAEVVAKNGTFYLIDQKSTNGTYLNDVRLNPLQEMELKNGDKIRISDETFVFKLM